MLSGLVLALLHVGQALAQVHESGFKQALIDNEKALVIGLAAWCGPCRAEVPAVNQIAREYEGRFAVLGMSLDFSRQDLDRFVERTEPAFPIYWLGEEAMTDYNVRVIPMAAVYCNGVERIRVRGKKSAEDFRRLLEPFLEQRTCQMAVEELEDLGG
jgi:thiol-disulfide isomerase/thioredoxin